MCGILITTLIVSCTKNESSDYIATGKDGNITWKLSKDGTLTIGGKGDMRDYTAVEGSWMHYQNYFTALVIEDGITSIGHWAFFGCDGFTGSLVLPESIKSIGDDAFTWCSGFTGSLTLPKGLTDIKGSSFAGCSGFTGSLIIPEGITDLDSIVFGYCSGFTGNLVLPEGLISIIRSFVGCKGFTDVINYSIEPQSDGGAFYDVPIEFITLHVPGISLEKYKVANGWKDFGSIVPIENYKYNNGGN